MSYFIIHRRVKMSSLQPCDVLILHFSHYKPFATCLARNALINIGGFIEKAYGQHRFLKTMEFICERRQCKYMNLL